MTELLEIFVDNIAPILMIAAIGYFAGRSSNINPQPISKILFLILSPALVFQSIYTSQITATELISLFFAVAIFMSLMSLIALGLMIWWGADRVSRASVILAAICANNGNFGLPLIALAFNSEVLARAAVVFVLVTMSNYSIGVFMASSGRKSLGGALLNILKVPAVYAAIFGLFFNFANIALPQLIAQPIQRLSLATVPMMLLLLGLQLSHSASISQFKFVGIGVSLRLLVSPFAAAALAIILGLNEPSVVAFIMQASMPVAVVTIILATEYELDRQLSLNMILASLLLSPITLSLLIYTLRRLVPSAI